MDSLVDHRSHMHRGMQADGLANGRDGILVIGKVYLLVLMHWHQYGVARCRDCRQSWGWG